MIADTPLVGRITPSPNHDDRRGRTVDCLILHYTGMRTGEVARRRLCDPAAQVSSHYLIWEDGLVEQLIPEDRRAWHAGRAFWMGEIDLNAISIGIEMVNPGHDGGCPPYPERQIEAVIALVRDLCRRHAIVPRRVLGHSDVAPDRKIDPGEHFPWRLLAKAGLCLDVSSTPLPAARSNRDVGQLLSRIGYAVGDGSAEDSATVLRAFQRRWRPAGVDGVADAETMRLLLSVAAAQGGP